MQETYLKIFGEDGPIPEDAELLIRARVRQLSHAIKSDWGEWVEQYCPGRRDELRVNKEVSSHLDPAEEPTTIAGEVGVDRVGEDLARSPPPAPEFNVPGHCEDDLARSPPPASKSNVPEQDDPSTAAQRDASDQAGSFVAREETPIRSPNTMRSSEEEEEEEAESDDSTSVLPFEMDMETWLSLGRGTRMKKWYEAQKKAGHDVVSNDLYPTKVILRQVSQCTLCVKARTFCVEKTDSKNGKCLHCIHRKQACSMAQYVNKGRPRRGESSTRSGPKKEPEEARKDEAGPSRTTKRKNTSEGPGPTKRVKLTTTKRSTSGRSVTAAASQPSNFEFECALRLIILLKDALSAAEAEIRRQQARGAAGPSHVGLGDLLALLLPSESDADRKGKGKQTSKR